MGSDGGAAQRWHARRADKREGVPLHRTLGVWQVDREDFGLHQQRQQLQAATPRRHVQAAEAGLLRGQPRAVV